MTEGRMQQAVTHVAGPYVGFVQRCTRCGAVLCDYRNSAWPADQAPPKGWEEGCEVTVRGNMTVRGRLDLAVNCGSLPS